MLTTLRAGLLAALALGSLGLPALADSTVPTLRQVTGGSAPDTLSFGVQGGSGLTWAPFGQVDKTTGLLRPTPAWRAGIDGSAFTTIGALEAPLSLFLTDAQIAVDNADTSCSNSASDYSAQIQAAIDAVAAVGGGVIKWPAQAAHLCAQNLVFKTGVHFQGAGEQISSLMLMKGGAVLFQSDQYATCMGASYGLECGPVRWGFRDITLDGNFAQNPTGAIIQAYSRAFTLNNVILQNAGTQCWSNTYPAGVSTINDAFDYVGYWTNVSPLFCNQSNQFEDPSNLDNGRGAGVYFDGPTDMRVVNTLYGYAMGSAYVKIGRWGNVTMIGDETFLMQHHFALHSIIGQSATGQNATLIGANLTGGAYDQILARTQGWTISGGRSYAPVMAPYTGSLTVGTGSFTITPDNGSGAGYPTTVGDPFEVYDAVNPSNYMMGTVTAYNATTGGVTFNATQTGGSGTFTSWQAGPMIFQGFITLGDLGDASNCPSWAPGYPSACWGNVANVHVNDVQLDNMNRFTVAGNSGGYNTFRVSGSNNTHTAKGNLITALQQTDVFSQRIQGLTTTCQNDACPWSSYTPTVTPSTGGALTSYTATGSYLAQDRMGMWTVVVTDTTNGSAAGNLSVSLPFTCQGPAVATGRRDITDAKALTGLVRAAGNNAMEVTLADGTYPGASGAVLYIDGHCPINIQ